jgi:hypothetical protein
MNAAFEKLSAKHGIVWYYRENAHAEPHPNAMQVMELVAKYSLTISLSTRPDFSNFVTPDGKAHPRKLLSTDSGSESANPPKANPTYGLTIKDSIEVCDPEGEDEYLSRLMCPAGNHPSFERTGSFGTRNPATNLSEAESAKMLDANLSGRDLEPGEIDYHIIDGFEVKCGESKTTVYLDMYHCSSDPDSAPAGFTIGG